MFAGSIQDQIKDYIVYSSGVAALLQRRLYRRRAQDREQLLVMSSTSPESLGDAAMCVAYCQSQLSSGHEVTVMPCSHSDEWRRSLDPRCILSRQLSLDTFSRRAAIEFMRCAAKFDRFIIFGADGLDGYYSAHRSRIRLELLSLSAFVGCIPEVVGCSFNAKPHPDAIKAIRRLPPSTRLRARDILSQQRLCTHTGFTVQLVADVAFLLSPDHETGTNRKVEAWIESQRAQSRTVIGINVHWQLFDQTFDTSDLRLNAIAEALAKVMTARSASLLLVPHDFRGELSDVHVLRAIFDLLPDQYRAHACLLDCPFGAAEAKAIVSKVDLVLTGRMHLAIAALGVGVPVCCIPYQDKFEGMLDHFGISGCTLNGVDWWTVDRLTNELSHILDRRFELANSIKRKLPEVLALAADNLV